MGSYFGLGICVLVAACRARPRSVDVAGNTAVLVDIYDRIGWIWRAAKYSSVAADDIVSLVRGANTTIRAGVFA